MSLADLMYESRHRARLKRMGWKMDGGLRCKLCGAEYDEDDPPDPTLKGYCSEACARKDRQIDKADATEER